MKTHSLVIGLQIPYKLHRACVYSHFPFSVNFVGISLINDYKTVRTVMAGRNVPDSVLRVIIVKHGILCRFRSMFIFALNIRMCGLLWIQTSSVTYRNRIDL